MKDIAMLIVMIMLSLPLILIGIILLTGRGADMIAGYNTLPKTEKDKYDSVALCKFVGKIVLPIGVLTPLVAVGEMLDMPLLIYGKIAIILGMVIFAVIYVNTGNRFRK